MYNELSTKKYSLRQCQCLASDNPVECPSKELKGLFSCPDPHIHPISVPSGQRTNEHAHILNSANQVTVHRNLSRSPLCLSPPWESHHTPCCSAGKQKWWFLSPKLPWLQNLQFFILPPCGPTTSSIAQKKEKNYCHLACRNPFYPSQRLLVTKTVVWPGGAYLCMILPQNVK